VQWAEEGRKALEQQTPRVPAMNQSLTSTVGLCADCRHVEIVKSACGSTFYLCRLSFEESHFSKYQTLPMRAYSPEHVPLEFQTKRFPDVR
jgi:hypothetical protein